MLRILLIGSACVLSSFAVAQSVRIGNNANPPNPAALLDLDVTNGGLLIPRMTEAQRLAITTAATENSLVVYQTDPGAAGDTTNARGFWYWDETSTSWISLGQMKRGWMLDGNTVATVTTGNFEFLGTLGIVSGFTPNYNLVFRVGPGPVTDPPAMQMGYRLLDYESGLVGLGTAAPATERLEVEGAIRVGQSDQLSPPREGTIRYGTLDGGASEPWNAANAPDPNLNWHWGTLVNKDGTVKWARLENAEELITPPMIYAKDTVDCVGGTGDAYRGNLSSVPVTMPIINTPANVYSPFATNYGPTTAYGDYRVQYLYRYEELVEAGLCFPATITDIAFFCLDQETLVNAGGDPTSIAGEVRGGAPTVAGLQGPSAYFGPFNTPQYMDNGVRTKAVNGDFDHLTPAPGWVNFHMNFAPITLNVGENLILDIVWSRSQGLGMGPRVELEDPGYTCTKWVINPAGLGNPATRSQISADQGAPPGSPTPAAATNTPTSINPHSWRPVTRFTGSVVSPFIKQAYANYLQYDGGIMIGDPTWAATPGNFRGPGTVKAQNGVYDGTLLLSDHVFDRYFDGHVRPEDQAATLGYAYTGLGQLRDNLERERRLPNMPSRQQWEATGGLPLGQLATGLWESVEDQALYITQLEKDLNALENISFGQQLDPQEAQRLIQEVQASRRLTEAQKMHLVGSIQAKALPNTEGK